MKLTGEVVNGPHSIVVQTDDTVLDIRVSYAQTIDVDWQHDRVVLTLRPHPDLDWDALISALQPGDQR